MRTLLIIALALLVATCANAQDAPLSVQDVEWAEGVGSFGQPVFTVRGQVINNRTDTAYTDVSLAAAAYDADDALIGEGVGVLVNACGAGLVFDFALQPGSTQNFSAPLELFEMDAEIARVEVDVIATQTEPAEPLELAEGITPITNQETVMVEWTGAQTFRYATGCETDLFTEWDWHNYNVRLETSGDINHPNARFVNDDLRERLQLEDDLIFANAMIRFAPDGDRLLYQDARNDLLSASFEGTFPRLVYSGLNNYSLRNIHWQPDERFIAYYFGAYGDPVLYFTATAENVRISPSLLNNPPSVIVPGITRDARRVVVAGTFDDVTGYFLYVVNNNFFEPLFEAEPPGNNYPAPIPLVDPETDLVSRVYVARDVDGVPTLQCFNRDADALIDLAPLPIRLTLDERAWWWLSPNDRYIALAADGANSGAWLIDLEALPDCAV